MIVFDTETTGLLAPEAAPLEQQPWVVEFAAIKLNPKTLEEIGRLEFLIKPGIPIPEESKKFMKVTQEMLEYQPTFVGRYRELCEFFGGQRACVAHNVTFDIGILHHALRRIGKATAFPWPPMQICTIEKTLHIKGYRLNLTKLHEYLFNQKFEGAHRAMVDVEALTRCVRELRKREIL